jgi:asparagine synthase (glutamine-hydrolysing)
MLDGSLLEAGCAPGGSALVIAAGQAGRPPPGIFDVFGAIPPHSEADGPDVHE